MGDLLLYFPGGLARLIKQATTIKPKILQSDYSTYILTAWGQVFVLKDDKFGLLSLPPVIDIYTLLNGRLTLIMLDASLVYYGLLKYEVEDVISVDDRTLLGVITVTGKFYKKVSHLFELVNLPEPVVAQAGTDFSVGDYFLLRQNGRVWEYPKDGQIKDMNVEDIISITKNTLIRSDGQIYERNNTVGDFELNTSVKNIAQAIVESDNELLQDNYTLTTRDGDLLYKEMGEHIGKYQRIKLNGACLTAAPKRLTAIRTDGRILVITNGVMVTVPRLNVFNYIEPRLNVFR